MNGWTNPVIALRVPPIPRARAADQSAVVQAGFHTLG
jgi:hypothetical protein